MLQVKLLPVLILPLAIGMASPGKAIAVPMFSDVSATAGLSQQNHHSFGAGAWGDFNGDGFPDLWMGNHATMPNLYQNNGDGTFTDIAPLAWTADPYADTHGVAWADFDRDGDRDLVELVGARRGTGMGANHLFINQQGTLTEQALVYGIDYPTGRGRTPLWLDWNRDGVIDLVTSTAQRAGSPSLLWGQDANNRFTPLPASCGFSVGLENHGVESADLTGDRVPEIILLQNHRLGPVYDTALYPMADANLTIPDNSGVNDLAVADFNNDLHNDIYLARNEKSDRSQAVVMGMEIHARDITFQGQVRGFDFQCPGPATFDLTKQTGPALVGAAGSVQTTNIFVLDSYAAASQGLFPFVPGVDNGIYIGVAVNGNWQYRTTSPTYQLRDVAITCNGQPPVLVSETGYSSTAPVRPDSVLLKHPTYGFQSYQLAGISGSSVAAGDFDNDMDIDLYVVNSGPAVNTPNALLLNRGDGTFVRAATGAAHDGPLTGVGDSVAMADYDRDGFLDLFISNGDSSHPKFIAPHTLLHNNGNANHWLEVDLKGVQSNIEGLGATVFATAGGRRQMREQTGGVHLYTQNHQRIHFGLGQNLAVTRLEIRWPSGIVQVLGNVAADQVLTVIEPPQSTLQAGGGGGCLIGTSVIAPYFWGLLALLLLPGYCRRRYRSRG